MKLPKFNLPLITFLSVAVGCTFLSIPKTPSIAPSATENKTVVTAPKVAVTAPKVAVTAPKVAVTAPKASKLVIPTGCAMAIDETFTQSEIDEFCAPKPTAKQIAAQDRILIDAHIARLKSMGR